MLLGVLTCLLALPIMTAGLFSSLMHSFIVRFREYSTTHDRLSIH